MLLLIPFSNLIDTSITPINEDREHLADSLLNVVNKVAPNETYVKKLSKEEIDEIINSICHLP